MIERWFLFGRRGCLYRSRLPLEHLQELVGLLFTKRGYGYALPYLLINSDIKMNVMIVLAPWILIQ